MTTSSLPFRATTLLVVLFALVLGMLAAHHFSRDATPRMPRPEEFRSGARYAAPRPLPAVNLVDVSGRSAGATEQLQGRWRLVFFGFTHCPGVCPAAMQTIDHTLRQLRTLPPALRPTGTLISVDPRRDTPEVVGAYVKGFNPAFEGYTGEESATDALAREVGVAVMRHEPDAAGDYMVDHTSAVFVLDDRARVRGILTAPLTAGNLAHDYRLIVATAGLPAGTNGAAR